VKPEDAIQKAIVGFLSAVLPKGWRCFAIPNGARRTASGRPANAVPGLTPGVPDLAIVGSGRVWFVEVKSKRGVVSEAQEAFHAWCATNGTPYCVARSVNDVRVALAHWGIPSRESRVEPLTQHDGVA
jgi:hypothetical protein